MSTTDNSSEGNFDAIKFMGLMSRHPSLYDFTVPEFKDQQAKTKAWQSLASEMKMPQESLMTKYRTQRTKLSKYLNSMRQERQSGGEIILHSKFEHVRWLVPFIKHRSAMQQSGQSRYPPIHTNDSDNLRPRRRGRRFDTSIYTSGEESSDEELHLTITKTESLDKVTPGVFKEKAKRSASTMIALPTSSKLAKTDAVQVGKPESPRKSVDADEDATFCKHLISKFQRVPSHKKSLVQWKLLKVFMEFEDEALKLQQYQVITNDDGTVLEVRGCADSDEALLLNDKGLKMAEWNKSLLHPLTDAGLIKLIKAGFNTPEDVNALIGEEAIEEMDFSVRDKAAIRKAIAPVDTSFLATADKISHE